MFVPVVRPVPRRSENRIAGERSHLTGLLITLAGNYPVFLMRGRYGLYTSSIPDQLNGDRL